MKTKKLVKWKKKYRIENRRKKSESGGESWNKMYIEYKDLAIESKSFLWWASMFQVSLLQTEIYKKAKTKICLKLKQKRKRETETEKKNETIKMFATINLIF